MNKIDIKIATAFLEAMIPAAATKDHRYYLNGVHLNSEAKRLESTDGCCALMVDYPLPDALDKNIILPIKFVIDIVKIAKASAQTFITITYNPDDKSLATATHLSKTVDGKYPPIDKALPAYYSDAKPTTPIDTKFIEVFSKAMKPLMTAKKAGGRAKTNTTPIAWLPKYGSDTEEGERSRAVVEYDGLTFVVIGLNNYTADYYKISAADVLSRLSESEND